MTKIKFFGVVFAVSTFLASLISLADGGQNIGQSMILYPNLVRCKVGLVNTDAEVYAIPKVSEDQKWQLIAKKGFYFSTQNTVSACQALAMSLVQQNSVNPSNQKCILFNQESWTFVAVSCPK